MVVMEGGFEKSKCTYAKSRSLHFNDWCRFYFGLL